jgi:hypothetical protein
VVAVEVLLEQAVLAVPALLSSLIQERNVAPVVLLQQSEGIPYTHLPLREHTQHNVRKL